MKKFLIVVIILLSTTCAGCFQANFDTIITKDGAVIHHSKFVGNAIVIRQIEEWKDKVEKNNPDVKAEFVTEGDLQGYKFKFNYPDIETFAKSAGDLYRTNVGKNNGVSRHATWFFDEYDLDFYFESSPYNVPPEAEFMAQAAFSNVKFDMSFQLPYSAGFANADEISADRKYLKWNLSPVLIHGGEKSMQARFRLWHRDKLAATAAVELLLLFATIFFAIKAHAEDLKAAKDFRFKRNVFAGLFVALTALTAYMIH